MRSTLVHMHKRKRRHSTTLEPYPSHSPWIRLLDHTALVAGVIGPAMTVPQIWRIYFIGDATGVSALSWGAFALLDIPFILYGLAHRNHLILITNSLWFMANLTVAIGAVAYG